MWSWTFRYPYLLTEQRDTLQDIKRKVPNRSYPQIHHHQPRQPATTTTAHQLFVFPHSFVTIYYTALSADRRVDEGAGGDDGAYEEFGKQLQEVFNEMVKFQRNMAQQDQLMQNISCRWRMVSAIIEGLLSARS